MDPSEHEDIVWLHTKVRSSSPRHPNIDVINQFTSNQLSGHANDLSTVYERIAFAIQRLQSEKAELQTRIDQLEQDNPSADVRRLRDENSMLRARLATTTREKAEVTRERDALFRKLHGIKQLIDDPAVRQSSTLTYHAHHRPFPVVRDQYRRTNFTKHDQHCTPSARQTCPRHRPTLHLRREHLSHSHGHFRAQDRRDDVARLIRARDPPTPSPPLFPSGARHHHQRADTVHPTSTSIHAHHRNTHRIATRHPRCRRKPWGSPRRTFHRDARPRLAIAASVCAGGAPPAPHRPVWQQPDARSEWHVARLVSQFEPGDERGPVRPVLAI